MALGGKRPLVVVVLFVEVFLSGLFIGLRWFTRKFVRGDIGADDYILVATWVREATTLEDEISIRRVMPPGGFGSLQPAFELD